MSSWLQKHVVLPFIQFGEFIRSFIYSTTSLLIKPPQVFAITPADGASKPKEARPAAKKAE